MNEADLPDDWTEAQSSLYMRTHRYMVANQLAMCHPKGAPIPVEHFQTIAHNAAFVAAELSVHESLRGLDADTNETIADSPGTLNS